MSVSAPDLKNPRTTFLEGIFDFSRDAMVMVGDDGRVIRINPSFTRIFGYSSHEALGNDLDELITPEEFRITPSLPRAREIIKRGTIERNTVRRCKDNTYVDVHLQILPIYDGRKRLGWCAIYRDLVELDCPKTDSLADGQEISGSGGSTNAHQHPVMEPIHLQTGERKENYETLFDGLPDPVFTVHYETGKILDFNTAALKRYGYTADRLSTMTVHQLHPPDQIERLKKGRVRVKSNKNVYVHITKGGDRFPVEVHSNEITYNGQKAWLAIVRELTERVRANKINTTLYGISTAVNSSISLDELYKTIHASLFKIIDVKNFGIAIYDKENDRLYFPFYVDEKDQPLNDSGLPYLPEAMHSASTTAQVIRTGKPALLKKSQVLKYANRLNKPPVGTLSEIWLGVPLKVRDRVIGALVTQSYENPDHFNSNDIDLLSAVSHQIAMAIERKRTEQELLESEERFRGTFEQAAVGIAHVSPDGRFLRINQKFCNIVGYSQEEMLDKTFQQITHPDYLDLDLAYVNQMLSGKISTYSMEKQYIRKDDSTVWVNLTVSLVNNPLFDEPKYFISVVEDISNQKQMMEAIRLNEERFREIAELLPESIFEMDLDGNLTYVNRNAYDTFGYSKADFDNGVNAFDMIIPHDRDRAQRNVRRILHGEKLGLSEYTIKRKDGTLIPACFHSNAIVQGGKTIGLRGVIIDISSRKKYEEALVEKNVLLEQLFETTKAAIAMGSSNHSVVRINSAFTELFGYTSEEAVGKDVNNLITPRHLLKEADAYRREVLDGSLIYFETVRKKKDGSLIDVLVTISQITINDQPFGYYALYHDISPMKKAEAALKQSEERYRDLYEKAPNAYFSVDAHDGKIIGCNAAAAKMFGYDMKSMLCLKAFDLYADTPQGIPKAKKHFAEFQTGKAFRDIELLAKRKDGVHFWVSLSVEPVKDSAGKVVESRSVMTDITHRKQSQELLEKAHDELEKRVAERTKSLMEANKKLNMEIEERVSVEKNLRKSNEETDALSRELIALNKKLQKNITRSQQMALEAQSANRAKSDFLANMSHELRTPLNHIIGFTQLVIDNRVGDLNEQQTEYLNDVLHSSEHLLSLINDILDLSKVEAGKFVLEKGNVNIPELIEESLIMIKEKALKHHLQIARDLNDIPDTIHADERKLKQIMYNLLSNAVKFTPDGGSIVISASPLKADTTGSFMDAIEISVSDTGIGIKNRDLQRIFDPFEQVEHDMSRKYQGTGLGLSLTKRLVELHGGKIWAESPGDGKGTTFHFVIPV